MDEHLFAWIHAVCCEIVSTVMAIFMERSQNDFISHHIYVVAPAVLQS